MCFVSRRYTHATSACTPIYIIIYMYTHTEAANARISVPVRVSYYYSKQYIVYNSRPPRELERERDCIGCCSNLCTITDYAPLLRSPYKRSLRPPLWNLSKSPNTRSRSRAARVRISRNVSITRINPRAAPTAAGRRYT